MDLYNWARSSRLRKGSRRAFVATNAAAFGVSRMFQAFLESVGGSEETEVFDNLHDAEVWIAQRLDVTAT